MTRKKYKSRQDVAQGGQLLRARRPYIVYLVEDLYYIAVYSVGFSGRCLERYSPFLFEISSGRLAMLGRLEVAPPVSGQLQKHPRPFQNPVKSLSRYIN